MRGKVNLKMWLMFAVFLLFTASTVATSKVIYVDDDAPVSSAENRSGGLNDGSSWENAYTYLRDALADANSAKKPVEIRVAQGIYTPDIGIGITLGDRNVSFQLINDVTVKGGYAGIDSPDPNIRDIESYETILTDNLNSNSTDTSGSSDLQKAWIIKARLHDPSLEDSTFRVVTGSGTNETAVLDGFTITAGNVERSYSERCAGMYIDAGCPTITNCTFSRNSASSNGGGVFCIYNSNPVLINCTFTLNRAICGGGVFNYYSNPKLTNCVFTDNLTTSGPTDTFHIGGGGIYNRRSNPILTNCIFSGNSATDGGGMYNYESNPILTNCIFIGNTGYYGGGIDSFDGNPILTNCTLSGNYAKEGDSGAISGDRLTLINCIIWGNAPMQITSYDHIKISYSNVQGGWEGQGNIDEDPLFVCPGYWVDSNDPNQIAEPNDPNAVWIDGDYHLKSQAGRYDPKSQNWVIDDVTSPCIDAGNPNNLVGDEPFPNGGIINMGAYGGTEQASKSYDDESF